MSEIPSPVPLDPGTTADTDPTDPNATNSNNTDPNASTPNLTKSPVPNGGNPEPNAVDPPINSNNGNVGGIDPDTGTVVLPQATRTADTSFAAPNGIQPSITPIPLAGNDKGLGLKSPSSDYRTAIIIASALSGAVAIILVMVVIYVVYRRRNKRRQSNKDTFVAGIPGSNFDCSERPTSDATWVSTHIATSEDSFNEATLEAGGRASRTPSFDSEATLADISAARMKSNAFGTPSHSPRPSLDKLKVASMPLVPEDPFASSRPSIAHKPRPSLDLGVDPGLQPAATQRNKRNSVTSMRINPSSSFESDVVIELGYDNGASPSPGFPVIPLMTPVEPPIGWRSHLEEFIPPPARRDSMASLSRQSSRASSRNSRNLEIEVISLSEFTVLAKKRRSRADSIDPFRKLMKLGHRSSRSQSYSVSGFNHRKSSRSERRSPRSPKSPKSPSGRRVRSSSVVTPHRKATNPTADPVDMSYFAPLGPVLPGLPKTPRTPTAARQSRMVSARTPRTPHTAVPKTTYTPRTSVSANSISGIQRPRTPMSARGLPRTPKTPRELPRTPNTTREYRMPLTAWESHIPREPHTPRTPGGRIRPHALVPRTPTSLDDAHWDVVPLPPAPVARPLPPAPLSAGRAELRLSKLSRALSEVSRYSQT